MTTVDLAHARDIAEAAARAGGAVLAATDRTQIDVHLKDERVDLTTSADAASQEAAVTAIRAAFPDHTVVGEEGTVPGSDSRHVWYVDGLDGTSNFTHGLPWFCVSVALRIDGAAAAGAVHDPVHDELFSAARGLGATCNGHPLTTGGPDEIRRAVVATQVQTSDPSRIARFTRELEALMNACGGVRFLGAPALLLSHIAAGHLTAYVEREMPPWDISAGQMILTEAGGRLTDLDGTDVDTAAVTDVVATNGRIHDALLAAFPR
ncbi:inositol monophosphatase family protein [Pseudonocardia endophytica]|uniref:Inositol-1-monophosphatase n=1 Tax=Pseudonocardia endophytica TaxID=401976 RepID=A0A4R1HEB1_PSEEN|nr:inositol monophosphatase family protein [Pseudonocardia endophytica]TCK19928.1 myo-inositol-1(or 4)-monophosphatase [Pseudonocardia endophytica]